MAKKTAALFLGLALAAGGVGCSNFILTDNEKDLNQTVATVDISATLAKDQKSGYAEVANDVKTIVNDLSSDISKRDLVAYFLNTGYQYVESYGYTYKDTFNMLIDGLISREIMVQYVIAYYLKTTDLSAAGCEAYINAELGKVSGTEKALLENNKEVLTLKYFLTENGENNEDFDRAVYSLKKSLNDSLDSLEENYIKAESEEHNHGDTRTLPTGVSTEEDDYYDTNYEVYTGRNVVGENNSYERVDGSTTSTRQKAYNAFLANLQSYNLVGTDENEDPSDIKNLSYYYVELSSVLGQSLLNKYYESMEDTIAASLTEEYVGGKYAELYESQKRSYASSPSDFETAMDSVSDTSFLLYGLEDFGYVYNILLPFSTSQEIEYTRAKNNSTYSQDALYTIRKNILKGVKGKDLRDSWFSEHDHANYAYEESEGVYKFFKDQTTGTENSQYAPLKQYAGNYAYNGKVEKTEDGEYKLTPNEITIDQFIEIFNTEINTSVGKDVASGAKYENYNATTYTNDKDEVDDYSKFMYYTGKTDIEVSRADYFNKDSDIYKAISAVNELMFAYSTDTGCLNTYFGYAVSPYGTDFVKEFEYAAQYVVSQGAGSYAVCATDYGWHIVYASFVYDSNDVYGGYLADQAEGTFSNMFYESIKESAISNYSTEKQNEVLNTYNNSASVTRFVSRYQDLLDMDN